MKSMFSQLLIPKILIFCFGNFYIRANISMKKSVLCKFFDFFAEYRGKNGSGKSTFIKLLIGELDPDEIHVAGIYIHHIFQGIGYEKRIERKTVQIKK